MNKRLKTIASNMQRYYDPNNTSGIYWLEEAKELENRRKWNVSRAKQGLPPVPGGFGGLHEDSVGMSPEQEARHAGVRPLNIEDDYSEESFP